MTTYNLTKNDTPKFISCSKKGTPKNGTSRTSIYGSIGYPPRAFDQLQLLLVEEKVTKNTLVKSPAAWLTFDQVSSKFGNIRGAHISD